MEQQTGSKLGKEYIKTAYCQPAYLTYMKSTSCEMLGWMKHKLRSRLLGEISIKSDTQMTPPYVPPEKSVCRVKKQQLEPDMEQQTGSKLGKEYSKAVYCHPAYLTYMQRVHHEKCWAA